MCSWNEYFKWLRRISFHMKEMSNRKKRLYLCFLNIANGLRHLAIIAVFFALPHAIHKYASRSEEIIKHITMYIIKSKHIHVCIQWTTIWICDPSDSMRWQKFDFIFSRFMLNATSPPKFTFAHIANYTYPNFNHL